MGKFLKRRIVLLPLLTLLGTYLVYLGYFTLRSRSILFPSHTINSPAQPLAESKLFWVHDSHDSVQVFVKAPDTSGIRPLFLVAHGNRTLIDDWRFNAEAICRRGFVFAAVEYPGYGRSSGEASQKRIRTFFLKAIDTLFTMPIIDTTRLVIYGRSIGGGVAADIAQFRTPSLLVLHSTFSSIADMARKRLLPPFVVRDPFDTKAVVRWIDAPVVIAHGTKDKMIPFENARILHRQKPESLLLLPWQLNMAYLYDA